MKNLLYLTIFLVFSCNAPIKPAPQPDRYLHIKDIKARDIIRASIENAGSIERWEDIKKLRYTKDYKLWLESGEEEAAYQEIHDYQFDSMKIDIQSRENGILTRTHLENGRYSRTKNGLVIDSSPEVLEKAVNTSTYVVSLPFKLLDPAATIQYVGEDTVSSGRVANVLQVTYAAENGVVSEVWRYYFDQNDARIVANWVQSSDHYSWIENLTYIRVGGILFNQRRQSFRVDSLGNKLYLRAEYLYDNYKIE